MILTDTGFGAYIIESHFSIFLDNSIVVTMHGQVPTDIPDLRGIVSQLKYFLIFPQTRLYIDVSAH